MRAQVVDGSWDRGIASQAQNIDIDTSFWGQVGSDILIDLFTHVVQGFRSWTLAIESISLYHDIAIVFAKQIKCLSSILISGHTILRGILLSSGIVSQDKLWGHD